jgi:hypothetical protein
MIIVIRLCLPPPHSPPLDYRDLIVRRQSSALDLSRQSSSLDYLRLPFPLVKASEEASKQLAISMGD